MVKYHVIPGELLFPDLLWDGMMKRTLLGVDYQVQFHLDGLNQVKEPVRVVMPVNQRVEHSPSCLQTAVNSVPLDSFMETQYGLVVVLPDVLQVQRNRCSKPFTVQVKVSTQPRSFSPGTLSSRGCEFQDERTIRAGGSPKGLYWPKIAKETS